MVVDRAPQLPRHFAPHTGEPSGHKKSPDLTVRGLGTGRYKPAQHLQQITWLRKRQWQRWQQRQRQPWQRRQQEQLRRQQQLGPRRRKQQELRVRQRERVQRQELPREREQVLERALPSCHKRRVQQQRSGRPERESSSFRFS